jgi:hypothetical protein
MVAIVRAGAELFNIKQILNTKFWLLQVSREFGSGIGSGTDSGSGRDSASTSTDAATR